MITTLAATKQAATITVATIMDIARVTMIITMITPIHHAITTTTPIMMIIMAPAILPSGPLLEVSLVELCFWSLSLLCVFIRRRREITNDR